MLAENLWQNSLSREQAANILWLIHFAATWFMVGLIWFVQIVHYPLYDRVGLEAFSVYAEAHTRMTTWVVAPVMILELITAVALLYFVPPGMSLGQLLWAFVLLGLIWLSTAILQVPCHGKLQMGYDAGVHHFLTQSNWVRTVLWSLRGLLLLTKI